MEKFPLPWSLKSFKLANLQVVLVVNARDIKDADSIPAVGKIPWGGNSNPFQYSYRENRMDRGAWQATVHRVAESDTTEVI